MDEDSRRAAIAALDAVHDGLRSGRRTDRDEPVSSWKRPVGAIIGVTIAVDVFMVVTGMGPQVVLVAALGGLVGVGRLVRGRPRRRDGSALQLSRWEPRRDRPPEPIAG